MPVNRSDNRARAAELRRRLTPAEARLWTALRPLRERGYHFRRQAPFRGYVLDFVCWSARLVIEVDGASHEYMEQADHDRVRDAALEREGFRTLRFWNHEIHDLEGVVDRILAVLGGTPPPGPLRGRPSRQAGGRGVGNGLKR